MQNISRLIWNASHPLHAWRLPIHLIPWLIIGLVPAMITLLLITVHMGATPANFLPYWSDEVVNWHQTLTFKEVGFQGGYYSVNETPPAASFTHFYTYGPWHSILYGLLARVTGWSLDTPLVVNTITFLVAVLTFCVIVRPDRRQLGLLALILMTSWPVLIFFLSYFQETFHQAIGIVSAAIFYGVIRRKGRLSLPVQLVVLGWILTAAISRASWSVLFVPYFVLTTRHTRFYALSILGKSALMIGFVLVIGALTGAPGNNTIYMMLGGFSISLTEGISRFVNRLTFNLVRYLLPVAKAPVDILQTVQVITFLIAAIVLLFRLRRRSQATPDETTNYAEATFHVLNLSLIAVSSMALYIIGTGGDYRVIAAHLLLSLLLLVAFKRYRPALALIAISLIGTPFFMSYYTEHARLRLYPNREAVTAFAEAIQPPIQYNAALADKPWCNTLLFDVILYDNLFTGVPGGIGLSFFFNADSAPENIKSLYVLVPDDTYTSLMARAHPPDLAFIHQMPNGATLYRNRDADCGELAG